MCSTTRFLLLVMLIAAGMTTAIHGDDDAVSPRVQTLQCEGRENPLGIDVAHPVLSWQSASSRRGMTQSAWQILVATDASLLVPGKADCWDSGRVAGAAQRTAYAGRDLRSMERVFWTVRIWDEQGAASDWSAPAMWTMGFVTSEDWTANWIGGASPKSVLKEPRWIWVAGEDAFKAEEGSAWFAKTFEVRRDADVRAARLYLAADNRCDVLLNDRRRHSGAGWQQASAADLTRHLQPGSNVLALRVTNDWNVPNPAGVFAQLDIQYADGVEETVITDGSWRGARTTKRQEAMSAPLAQELGPFHMEPWNTTDTLQQHMPLFRKQFLLADKPVRYAVANISGLGHFEMRLNGVKVGDHVLDPGWTDYKDTCLYVSFDVTRMLHPGDNALGVLLGNGLYNVVGGRYTKFTGSFGLPKMILRLHVVYEDGTEQEVVSDDSWSTHDSPIVFSCAYGGEDYDARLEMPGWDAPGFSADDWIAATVTDGPGGVLRASEAPPIKVMDTLKRASIKRTAPGCYEADMGYNLSARPVLTVKGAAGSSVTLRVGELEGKPWDGHSYTYTLRGGDAETYAPYFTYFGFQYIVVEGADLPEDADGSRPVLLDLASEFVTSAAPVVGGFECSNPLLNEIDAMIARSVRSNLQSVITDCPHREKLGWLEVAHLMGPSILYHYDAFGLYRKICRDTTESQLENGMVPDIAPEYTRFSDGFFESAEWGSAAVQLPWLLYRWYGDMDILARQYDTMTRYTAYLAGSRNDAGLAKAGLGDWYDWTPEKGHIGYSQLTPGELTATAMLYDNARIVSETAALLGKATDAAQFRELAQQVRHDFIAAYYDAERHTVATGSQAALGVGLYFGLIPEEARQAVLDTLLTTLEADAYKPSTGEVCFRYMIMALAQAGRSDIVYRIINRTDCPGYGWMLREYGLQTLSEQWDKPGSSLNHCMFGHAQEWFQGYVLGIAQEADSIGFERLRIAPLATSDLAGATGYFDSPRGRVGVEWHRTPEEFAMDITIPGNTIATVVLPVPPDAAIMESGILLSENSDAQLVGKDNEGWHVKVGSGDYRFVCNMRH